MFDGVNTTYFDSWTDFKSYLVQRRCTTFVGYGQNNGTLFRGQGDAAWPLKASLDRQHPTLSGRDRNRKIQVSLGRFVEACKVQGLISDQYDSELAIEIFAQHHGLPTRCLDWSSSIYIAAFFAFSDISARNSEHVAIWSLNVEALQAIADKWPVLVTDIGIRRNVRIMNQFGYVTLSNSESGPFEMIEGVQRFGKHLPDLLQRVCIPFGFAAEALMDLRGMGISYYSLFGTVDSIAKDIAMESIYALSLD
jgi:hypothetical protein